MTDLRTPSYLSPSARSMWLDKMRLEDAVIKYIMPKSLRPEREPQTDPMSVGSAFDALVKAELALEFWTAERISSEGFRRRDLIEKQCEGHTLPDSLEKACILFDQYIECGAYGNLVSILELSPAEIGMEFDVTATIGGVPLLGKPDLVFLSPFGMPVIGDWKVSGSCSKDGVSPQQGFQMSLSVHKTRTNGKCHGKYEPVDHGGLQVSKWKMNESTNYWADQLSTYAWCKGFPVGSEDWIARIEQIAVRPDLRANCCVHQSTVDADYQTGVLESYQMVWSHIQAGHYFWDRTKQESDDKCNQILNRLRNPSPVNGSLGTQPAFSWGASA